MNKQSGFTLIEGLIIFLVICVVSFAGWYVWNNNQEEEPEQVETTQQEEQQTQNNQQNKQITEETSSIPDGWVVYESESDSYTVAYPSDWKINDEGSTSVTVSPSMDGAVPNIYIWLASLDNSSCDQNQTGNQLKDVLVDGIASKQYVGGSQTDKITTCIIRNDKVYHIVHAYFDNPLQTEYDQLVESFRFN